MLIRIDKATLSLTYSLDNLASAPDSVLYSIEPINNYVFAFIRHGSLPTAGNPYTSIRSFLLTDFSTNASGHLIKTSDVTSDESETSMDGTFSADGSQVVVCFGNSNSDGSMVTFFLYKYSSPGLVYNSGKGFEMVDTNDRYVGLLEN